MCRLNVRHGSERWRRRATSVEWHNTTSGHCRLFRPRIGCLSLRYAGGSVGRRNKRRCCCLRTTSVPSAYASASTVKSVAPSTTHNNRIYAVCRSAPEAGIGDEVAMHNAALRRRHTRSQRMLVARLRGGWQRIVTQKVRSEEHSVHAAWRYC